MKKSFNLASLNGQRGIVGILAAIFLITAVIFVLTQTRLMSGTVSLDNAQQRDSTAAFFLAESGAEAGQALLMQQATSGKSVYQACNSITLDTPVALGDGTYQYTSAQPLDPASANPTTCTTSCKECVLTVKGTVGHASRSVAVSMAASGGAGIEGFDSVFTLSLKAEMANTFAFTHLAFNPPSNWETTGQLDTCTNVVPGTSVTGCTQSWNIRGTQYNNTASEAVLAQIPGVGSYSLTQSLSQDGAAIKEDFVEVGVLMRPSTGFASITHKGSYAQAPSGCPTVTNPRTMPVTADCGTYDYQRGYLPANWTCNASNGTTANWNNAGDADTLLIGFGGKPYSGGSVRTNRLSAISLNGQQFHNQVEMVGTQKVTGGDGRAELQYSQLWYAYNPGYYSSTANATNISTTLFTGAVGAQFTGYIGTAPATVTGSIGANFTGTITNNSSTMTVTDVSSGVLSPGDTLSGVRNNTSISNQVSSSESGGVLGLRGVYTLSRSQNSSGSKSITAASNVLNVTNVTSGQLTVNGALSSDASGADVAFGTTITALGTGTGGIGTYTLSGSKQTVTPRTITQASSSSTTLTITDISSAGLGGQLRIGDTLSSDASGTDVRSGSTITAFLSGTGGVGTYTVSGSSQSVTSRTITADSRILRVSEVTSGTLTESAQITSGMGTCTTACPTIQAFSTTGTTGSGLVGDYVLGEQYAPVNSGQPTAMTASSGGTGTRTITLAGATTLPVVGTALSVVSGTGQYLPDTVTGSITGTTMTVTAVVGTPELSAGDALFGQYVQPQTTIVNQITPLITGEATGRIGRYTVSINHTATPSAVITARVAVVTVTSANSFTVSRLPESPGVLSGARLCGGVCPFLKSDGSTPVGRFNLTGVQDYDDWSGGFACLQGVDPSSILNAAQVLTKRTRWREVVQ